MPDTQDILFGFDPTPGIVSVETGNDRARVYLRVGDCVVTEECELRHWLLTTARVRLPDAEWTELDGEGFRWLAEFPTRAAYLGARGLLRDSHAEHIAYPSSERQYLTRTGRTLFKGMSFGEVRRLQLDIETAGLDPQSPANEIFLVSITDSTGFECSISGTEKDILRRTVETVRERDPDVIEGHNIYGFDLPYLACRAKRHGVRLCFGRDGSQLCFGQQQNCSIGYFSRPYAPAIITGRQLIDTLFGVQRYDVARGALSSHGLKAVAVALGIAEQDRELIPHEEIASEWREHPERVLKYGLQDVRETRSLAALVCPAEFYLAQMVPETYSRCATCGTGEKINYILTREYLRQGKAIPRQSEPEPLPGGYTEVRTTGLVERVLKCDVESLYPSIMLTQRICPESDSLGVFLPALEELTRRRIEAKRNARQTSGAEAAYWDGLQGSFKILINSFYGYLGGPFNFNDYTAAAKVTTTGQAVVKSIVDMLESTDSTVVEVDTDGVYFRPPDGIADEVAEVAYIDKIGSDLPQGIRLAHDGRYAAMISLKMKNYVLLGYEGKLTFRGSSLRSRADEKFGIEFISAACELLLRGQKQAVKELYDTLRESIYAGKLPLEKFVRRERVTQKTFTSAGRQRLARAAASASVGEYVTVYQRTDGSLAPAHEYDSDEDRDCLLDKLHKFACRLREAFGDDFDILFPRPTLKTRLEAAGQQTLSLFE